MTVRKRVALFAAAVLLTTSATVADPGDAFARRLTGVDDVGPASAMDEDLGETGELRRRAEHDLNINGANPAPRMPATDTAQAGPGPLPGVPLRVDTGCPDPIESALGRAGCMVSFCESGWNPNATGSAGERGWFQIHPAYHADATYDPAGNVAAAVRISRNGTNWQPWSVRNVLVTGVCPSGVPYPG